MQIHEIEGYIQTILLIEYPDKLLLLDGGCRCDVDIVEQYITKTLSRDMDDLTLVLISHMHPDHAGGAALYQKKYQCKIASVDSGKQWYGGFAGRIAHWIDIFLALYVARRKGKKVKNIYYNPNLKPDIILTDLMLVPGFEEWQVHETPGHTDRDLSFLHRPSHQMYTGDLILRLRKRFVSPFPIYQPQQYKASLKKLITLDVNRILMAHDGAADISHEEIETLISRSTDKPVTVAKTAKYKLRKLIFSMK